MPNEPYAAGPQPPPDRPRTPTKLWRKIRFDKPLGKFAADAVTPGRKPGETPEQSASPSPSLVGLAPPPARPRTRPTRRGRTRRSASRRPRRRVCAPDPSGAPDLPLPVRYRSMAGVRTVLTGGTGVIGRAAVTALLERGTRRRRRHPLRLRLRARRASSAPGRCAATCSTSTAWPPPTRAPTRSSTWPPRCRSATARCSRAPGGATTGCARPGSPTWSRRLAGPAYDGWCRRASASCTPTRATSGSPSRAPSTSPR